MAYASPSIPASGLTFAQMLSSGASGHLEKIIAGLLTQSAPTATPTVSVTGTGGTLPAGVYYGRVTYVDSSLNANYRFGETTPGPEFTFTQVAGDEPIITFNDSLPAWASGRNLYLTGPGGGSGSETLAATGLAGSTYTLTAAPAASTVTPPTANTTTIQGTAPPSAAPTLAASGTGNTLPAATYYVVFTETNGIGETTASPASSGQAITLGQLLTITPPALKPGNVARNYYVGTSSPGPFTLAVTGSTGSTQTITAPLPSNSYAVPPPTANSTGLLTQMGPVVSGVVGATVAPSAAPTLSATGGGTAGGELPAGTVYVKVTETNGVGETTASPEASVAIAAGDIPLLTFTALNPGNSGRNVYVGTSSGAETLYAAVPGDLASYPLATPLQPTTPSPPSSNTTGTPIYAVPRYAEGDRKMSAIRAAKNGRLQDVWSNLDQSYRQWSAGSPAAFADTIARFRDAQLTFAALAQLCAEAGALIDANPGHLTTTTTGVGLQKPVRVWP